MALPPVARVRFVETRKVVYREAYSNHTRFHLSGGEVYTVAKALGNGQEVPEAGDFRRAHRRCIVSPARIQRLVKEAGTNPLMTNGYG